MADFMFYGELVTADRIIYTPSEFAKKSLIFLQETGRLTAQKPHVSKRENLKSYLFFMVLHGRGTLRYQGKSYDMEPGDCGFIDCRRLYSHESSEELWTLRWVHFYGDNMQLIYDKYVDRGGEPCFHTEKMAEMEALLTCIHQTAASASGVRDMQLYEKLTSLLVLLMDEGEAGGSSGRQTAKKRNLQNIKDYIDHNYCENITLDGLAGTFYINKYYLTRVFKEQYGSTINHYLQQVRITHAKQLLRFTDWSIERVGEACGIQDGNYFTRVFRKIEGMAPGEYRKLW